MKKMTPLFLLSLALLACTDYGKKVSSTNIEVYYKEGISKEQAEKTARLFDEALNSSNPGDEAKKSFQLMKTGDTVLLKMVADKSKLAAVGDESFYAITVLISDSVFAGGPVNLTLTDDTFKGFKHFAFQKKETPTWGDKYESGNVEVFDDGVGATAAKDLAAYMESYFNPATIFSFQLTKNEQQGIVARMVVNPEKMNVFTEKDMLEISEGISTKALNGAPVQFQLTDATFNPLRTFSYPADAAGVK